MDREIMLEFEKDIKRANRAIIVAIVFMFIFCGALIASFVLQGYIIKDEYTHNFKSNVKYNEPFVVYPPFTTPVEIEITKQVPCDMALLTKHNYDLYKNEGNEELLVHAVVGAMVEDSTEFKYEGELPPGDYVLFFSATNSTDSADIMIHRQIMKPCFIWEVICVGVIVALLILRVCLKIRRIGIIKKEREEYLKNDAQKSNQQPAWAPPPANQAAPAPDYSQPAGQPQNKGYSDYSTPVYSSSDMDYFDSVGDEKPKKEEKWEISEDQTKLAFNAPDGSRKQEKKPPARSQDEDLKEWKDVDSRRSKRKDKGSKKITPPPRKDTSKKRKSPKKDMSWEEDEDEDIGYLSMDDI